MSMKPLALIPEHLYNSSKDLPYCKSRQGRKTRETIFWDIHNHIYTVNSSI